MNGLGAEITKGFKANKWHMMLILIIAVVFHKKNFIFAVIWTVSDFFLDVVSILVGIKEIKAAVRYMLLVFLNNFDSEDKSFYELKTPKADFIEEPLLA